MKILKDKRVIFFILIIIGVTVRAYNFPNAISEINIDEIVTIANAKSIADTGKELTGINFPVYLQGWGGQSVILLYLMSLSIRIFGFTLFAVRLPMLLISIISMFIFYDLVKKISKNTNIALIALALLSICPWHILQSIWGLDCNMFPHFLLIAIDLLYTAVINRKKLLLYISMIVFAVSLYGYGVAIYFVPLFLVCILLYLLKIKIIRKVASPDVQVASQPHESRKLNLVAPEKSCDFSYAIKIRDIIICAIAFLVVAFPIITMFIINVLEIKQSIEIGKITIPYYESLSRTKDMVFFSPNPLSQLIKNIVSTLRVIFVQTDGAEWNASVLFGATYRITIVFIIIGLIKHIKEIKEPKEGISSVVILFWVGISFLTGLIVNEANINRLNSIWYVLLILGAYGIYALYEKVNKKELYKIIITSVYIVIFIIYAVYFHVHYVNVVEQSGCFSRGFYQTLNYVNNLDKEIILYDNMKNNPCLELYIEFNKDNTKTYKSIRNEEELEYKMQHINNNEALIVDVEYRDYSNVNYSKQIGDFVIIYSLLLY